MKSGNMLLQLSCLMTVAISSANSYTKSVPVAATQGAMAKFAVMASVAAAVDLLTKSIATGFLSDGHVEMIGSKLAFMLVYNTGGAGGFMVGPYTILINVLVTIAAIAMVARVVGPLASIDARAVPALALVTGGAFGNLASMMVGPAGVADFIAFDISDSTTIVMNVADLLLWTGALMLIPVVARLVRAVLAERRSS